MDIIQRHLRMALDAARMTIWDSEITDGKVFDNTVHWVSWGAGLLGLPDGDLSQPFTTFLQFVHADDREQLLNTMQHLQHPPDWPSRTAFHTLAVPYQLRLLPRQRQVARLLAAVVLHGH